MKRTFSNLKFNREQLTAQLSKLQRYSFPIFLVFVGLIYVFMVFRIHGLSSAQPSEAAVNDQVNAAQIPTIEKSVVQQLQSLQDNSVNVQALFNQARSNPFQ